MDEQMGGWMDRWRKIYLRVLCGTMGSRPSLSGDVRCRVDHIVICVAIPFPSLPGLEPQ